MNKVQLVLALVLFLSMPVSALAFQYVVASDGIYFYDTSSIDDNSWPRIDLSSTKCKVSKEPIHDSGGARGVIVKKCFNEYNPVGYCWIRTYDYDFSLWKQVTPLRKTNDGIFARCYRVFVK